jgi:hypothetical protein
MVTIFKNIFDRHPYYAAEQVIFDKIKTGGKNLDLITQIRSTSDKEARNELKKQLGVVLWSGKFSERKTSALLEYSHLICLDFDNVNVSATKESLKSLPFIYSCFTSPSGDGVKAIVKVSSKNHLAHFKALSKEFDNLDQSGKDQSRACYMSYDSDIYVNPHPEIYTKVVEQAYSDEQRYSKLKLWLENKGEKFVNGNRNNFLAKLAGACNRFGIPQDFTIEVLQKDYVNTSSNFSTTEARNVVNSVYTNYSDQFDTVSFDEVIDEKKLVEDILSTELVAKDIITAVDVKADLMSDFDNGTPKGGTTYFPIFDNHFRFLRGEITTMTGIASTGKSTLLSQLLLFRAAFNGEKAALLSMEQYPPVFFYKELIRALIGKPLEVNAPDRMTRKEYEQGLEFINQHFFFIYPEKEEPTPEWTLARFYEAIVKHSVSTCVVDPYNSQSHDFKNSGGRDDKYISAMLNKSQRFALHNNIHYFTVAHPRSLGKDDEGYYKEPTADEISGGPVWFQRSDNVLIYHRPSLPKDYQDPTCTLRSAKIKKQSVNGKPGSTDLIYDWRTGRFYENKFNPLDSFTL